MPVGGYSDNSLKNIIQRRRNSLGSDFQRSSGVTNVFSNSNTSSNLQRVKNRTSKLQDYAYAIRDRNNPVAVEDPSLTGEPVDPGPNYPLVRDSLLLAGEINSVQNNLQPLLDQALIQNSGDVSAEIEKNFEVLNEASLGFSTLINGMNNGSLNLENFPQEDVSGLMTDYAKALTDLSDATSNQGDLSLAQNELSKLNGRLNNNIYLLGLGDDDKGWTSIWGSANHIA